MLIVVFIVIAAILFVFGWIGKRQVRCGLMGRFSVMLMAVLSSTLVCFLTGSSQSGTFLSGLMGLLMAAILALGGVGFAVGGLMGAVLRFRPRATTVVAPQGIRFDAVLFYFFICVALTVSLSEKFLNSSWV